MASAKKDENKEIETKNNELMQQDDISYDLSGFNDFGTESGTTGLENVDATDIKLPQIKLLQPMSQEVEGDVKAGMFYNMVTKEVYPDGVECILLALGKSRVMWPDVYKKNDDPLCRSIDAVVKVDGGIGDGHCESCKYAQWKNDEPSPCKKGYVWLAIDRYGNPFRINARGASFAPTKDFINTVLPKLQCGKKHLGIFVFTVKLSSEYHSDDKGKYYSMKYTITGTIKQDAETYHNLEEKSVGLRELFMAGINKDTQTYASERDDTYVESEAKDVTDKSDSENNSESSQQSQTTKKTALF